MSRLLFLWMSLMVIQACSHTASLPDKSTLSVWGTYHLKGNNKQIEFELTIRENYTYLLCKQSECFEGQVEKIPNNYSVILLDFYLSQQGKKLEALSFGRPLNDDFIAEIRNIRSLQPRTNDLAFNLTLCADNPCVRIGHSRRGVQFIKTDKRS